jgi:O-antigen/teichoic acid export membrane protein
MMHNMASIGNFIFGLQIHLSISFLVGLFFLFALPKNDRIESANAPIHWLALIKKSIVSQYSNWLFFLSTRISFYIIYTVLKNNEQLGIYSAASVLTEAIWIIPVALATPLYPAISSGTDKEKIVRMTNEYAYSSFWLSFIALAVLLATPEFILEFIIGKDFKGLHTFILILSAGTVILSYAKIYWNYFQGMGLFSINAKATLISFVLPITGFLPFITILGVYGVALMSCTSYIIYSMLLLYYYKRETGTAWNQLLLPPFRLLPKF